MSWQVNYNNNGQVAGVGSIYPPRGIYKALTVKADHHETKSKKGWGLYFEAQVQDGFAFNFETKKLDPAPHLRGQTIKSTIMCQDGQSTGGDEARAAELNSALISHGARTEEQVKQAGGASAQQADFLNRECFLIFDPPPMGLRGLYPQVNYVSREDALKYISGEKTISWHYDQPANLETKPTQQAGTGAPPQASALTQGRPVGAPGIGQAPPGVPMPGGFAQQPAAPAGAPTGFSGPPPGFAAQPTAPVQPNGVTSPGQAIGGLVGGGGAPPTARW